MKKDFKIRIFQPIIQEYRLALYEGLGKRYPGRIELWASPTRGDEQSLPVKGMSYDYGHPMKKLGPVLWQQGFSLFGLERGDVIVVCGDIHQLSSLWIAFKAKLKGVKVVWWGHHKSALAEDRNVRIRLWIARRLADVMLCYTDIGIRYLTERGFKNDRVFATGNTLDLAAVEKATADWDGIRKFGKKNTLLFCGVLRDKVRVDILLEALRLLLLRRNDIHCIIIGGGEKESDWKEMARRIGVDGIVKWVGELRGQENLAPWFLSADVFVYPGRIGLSIIHAFAFGLPVILNDNSDNHGPEYEAFHPGVNGWAFKENDAKDLARCIEAALADSSTKEYGEAGRRYVLENYSMSRMVERFGEAIDAAAAL